MHQSRKKQKMSNKTSVLKSSAAIFESMLNGGATVGSEFKASVPYTPKEEPKVPDISKVDVPQELYESIISRATGKPKPPVAKLSEAVIKSKAEEIVLKFQTLIKEAKVVIDEMCGAGMLGTSTVSKKK